MEEKLNQAVDAPGTAADSAQKQDPSQAPTADAEQGAGAAAASAPKPDDHHDLPRVEAAERDESTQAGTSDDSDDNSVREAAQPEEVAAESSSAERDSERSEEESQRQYDQDEQEVAGADRPVEQEAAGTHPSEVAPGEQAAADEPLPQSSEQSRATAGEPDAAVPPAIDIAADSEAMTMEQVMAAEGDQLGRKPIHRGMITAGTVIMLSQEGIVVDVGAKIEGVIPYNQLFEFDVTAADASKYFKPGDEVQVYVVRADIPNGTIVLSKKRADQERAWNLLHDIFEKKLPVEVEIVEKVRGGLVANLGVRAFLPASQVDVRRVSDLTPYVDKRLRVKIIELNRKRNRVIISRRAIVEEEIKEQKAETLKKLEPGARLEGEIVEITDFGAFVNLGGIDGLVHRSELTHGRFNHPRDVIEVGQRVDVEVLDMDLERERINLSMKRLAPNPWQHVLANYTIGQKVAGKVTNLTPFGAFVEIEPGLEGLIHVSEMSWTKRVRHPKEIVNEGDEVEALILKIDTNQERISLGLRQTQPDPWSSLPDRYPPGTEITGKITGITEFGVFMEIEEGIEGLVHISELAHEHIEEITEHFNRGDEVTAVILNIDPVEQRASLSRKRLLPYAASESESVPMGAPAGRGGARKGRRGGRRSAGIDYDYSYAASDAGGKTTTKLGDVYADLFAQFGLTEKQAKAAPSPVEDEGEAEASSQPTATEVEAEQEAPEAADTAPAAEVQEDAGVGPAPSDAAPDAALDAGAERLERPDASTEPTTEPSQPAAAAGADAAPEVARSSEEQAREEREEVDPENAIDAAEAAALLTAAFRQGRRPVSEHDDAADDESETNSEGGEEKETSNS